MSRAISARLIDRSASPATSPASQWASLLIPALYIDNINPIGGEPNEDEPEGDGYGSSGSGKRFIAAVTTVNVDAQGQARRHLQSSRTRSGSERYLSAAATSAASPSTQSRTSPLRPWKPAGR